MRKNKVNNSAAKHFNNSTSNNIAIKVKDAEIRKIILDIVEKIKKEYQPSKIILFGSYAYGQPDRSSDIDLLIIKETTARPIDRRVTVARIASDPERLIPFEPIVLTSEEVQARLMIGDQFLKEILTKGEVLHAA
jgi:predicted nucleotidyltransferase